MGLTGTLLSGYADDLFNTLFRTDAKRMIEDGYEWGSAGSEPELEILARYAWMSDERIRLKLKAAGYAL